MIDRDHALPLVRQAKALNISRGSVYYKPRPDPPEDLALMRRIDELHLEYPFAGARMLRDMLGRDGFPVGRRRVATLMKRMGIAAIYSPNITNTGASGSGTIKIYNNTFWNNSTRNPFGTTGVLEIQGSNMTMNAVNNLVYAPSGVAYISKGGGGIITGSNNLWFGNGASPSGLTSSINLDPLFVNASNKDFHLQALSLAIGAGSITTVPTRDNDGLIRPVPPSIGAFEYFSGTVVQRPNPPTNLLVSVQ